MKQKALTYEAYRQRVKAQLRLGAHLLVFVSGVSLMLTQKLWISSGVLIFAAVFTLLFKRRPLSTTFWEVASFLYLLFFFADWFWVTRSLAPSLVHLFIFIIINKLFNLQSDRDYYQLYLLTFLSMLAATALSVEIEMLYMIVLFLVLFVWNFMSITLIKTWSKSEDNSPFPFSLFGARYWGFISLSTLVMMFFALGIFFLLPRAQLGYFGGNKQGQTQHVSGFSSKVELGEIADIQENTTEVMRISVTGAAIPPDHRFYWRGMAFDQYDGKSWSTSNPATNFLFQDSSSTFYVSTDHDPPGLIKQELYLSPIDSRVVFGQNRIIKVEGNFFGVSRDLNGTLKGMGIPQHYSVYSQIPVVSENRLRSRRISYSENLRRYYTKLPDRNPDVEQLAQEITAGIDNVYDRVKAVQTYLETNYQYTTTNLPMDRTDPVAHFLFNRKVGHCEYFATSMVILLRHLGIPARLVNGFLEGEFNEIGKFYVVRQSDAHSWVEVYFGNGLWMQFDPSPRSVAGIGTGGWWEVLNFRKMLDSINFFWDRYILIYSAQDQINALLTIRDRLQQANRALKDQTKQRRSLKSWWGLLWPRYRMQIIAILMLPVFFYYALQLYRARIRRLQLVRTPILFYQQMLMLLQQRGFIKPVAATPSEFVQNVSSSLPDSTRDDVAKLTTLFYKARFGHYALTREDQAYVASALSRLQRWE